jgi:SHS2 domain-containing protein
MNAADSAFEFVEGTTSDLSFVARGKTVEEAFAAAAEAVLAATVERPASVESRARRRLALEEPDLELLLLHFLNELIYFRDAEGLLLRPEGLRIDAGPPARLEAELAGEEIEASRHLLHGEVKAATAYQLSVRRGDTGWEARVTLDV